MEIKKEEILELKIGIYKFREKIIAGEAVREKKINDIRTNYEAILEPMRRNLKTNEDTLKEKRLALK